MSARETTAAIEAAMRVRYAPPEWGLAFGVGNSTGHRCSGWADAVAMNLWPSRGLAVHGFEFKASRGDWIKELRAPEKAENVARYCDFWWLVVGERKIVAPGELPAAWGLLELTGRGLAAVQEPTRLQAEPLDRGFVAAILRRTTGGDDEVVEALARKRVAELRRADAAAMEREREQAGKELVELRAKLREIRDVTGVDLLNWRPAERFIRAYKLVNALGLDQVNGSARVLLESAERFAAEARAILNAGANNDTAAL